MAWSNSKQVGNFGSRLIVEVVLNSQSQANNTSSVTVRIRLRNGGNSTAFDNNGTSWSISGGAGSASGSDTFSIGAGSTGTLASRTFTVSHNSDGNKTISVTANVGATGTSTFGTPGSLTVSSIVLPRIPRVPSKPSRPSVSGATSTSYRANLSAAPAANGAPVVEYQWEAGNDFYNFTSGGRSVTIPGRTPNTQHRTRVRARNSVGWGPWSDWSAYINTLPNAPAAPTGVSVARSSDTRHVVSWTTRATSTAPYASQQVQRTNYRGPGLGWANWTTIDTVGASTTSYVDTTTVGNAEYKYRIVARNASDSATSGESNKVQTTPAAPVNVVAKKQGDSIVVSFERKSPYTANLQHILQDSPNGGAWVTVATVNTEAGPITHVDPNPAVTHTYRVATRNNVSGNVLTSAWSAVSNVVQLLAPPLAPTLVAPTGTQDRDADIVFRWIHNSVDTTDQVLYELRYRVNGGVWTQLGGTNASSRTVPALGVFGTVEWQVRTKGDHASFGPWSAISAFPLASRPTVAINTPEGPVLEVSTVHLRWGYDNVDPSAQSQWQAELRDDDGIIEQRSGTGSVSSTLFQTALVDDATYTVRVRARSGAGIWSDWDTVTFTTDFPAPAKTEVFGEWDIENGSVVLTFEALAPVGDETDVEYIDVQRDEGDGWITIATDLDPETSIVDHTPRLGEVRYRAISRTSLPSAQLGDETLVEWVHGAADPIYVSGGPGFGVVCTAIGHEVSDAPVIEQALQEWAGWPKATAVFGEGESYTVQFQGNIFPHMPEGRSTREEWHALLLQRGIVCYRDCEGRKVYGLLGVNFSTASSVTRLSLTVDETEFIEGVPDAEPVPDEGGD